MNPYVNIIPDNVKSRFSESTGHLPVNGRLIYNFISSSPMIIMACNPRIKQVIPGIMRAASELDSIVAFELSQNEGGLDGGYTGTTPSNFVSQIIEYATMLDFSKPYIIHADHIMVTSEESKEIDYCSALIADQIKSGYTSFAIDASFNPVDINVHLIDYLSKEIRSLDLGLEVELGEVPAVGSDSPFTTIEEAEEFLEKLSKRGINPDLIAINNGSHSGNYLESHQVYINLELTGKIFEVASNYGVKGLVQHGITGTPLRIVGKLADYGIRKGNIGTLWQNVAHACLPLELMSEMKSWAKKHDENIKYATKVFMGEINSIPVENIKLIEEMAYHEAKTFIDAFKCNGSAGRFRSWLDETG